MSFMINVDRETLNDADQAVTVCRSQMHAALGAHYDLTVHTLGCRHRRGIGAHRPKRFWDDNGGMGYRAPQDVVQRLSILQAQYPQTFPRRAVSCGVSPNLPHWD